MKVTHSDSKVVNRDYLMTRSTKKTLDEAMMLWEKEKNEKTPVDIFSLQNDLDEIHRLNQALEVFKLPPAPPTAPPKPQPKVDTIVVDLENYNPLNLAKTPGQWLSTASPRASKLKAIDKMEDQAKQEVENPPTKVMTNS